MAHEIAKLLLKNANNFLERREAVKSALALGMPLDEIEAFMDWLELGRALETPPPKRSNSSERKEPK